MKKILVTGAAGLFGVNFCNFLLKKGYFVIGIDNFFGGYKDFLPKHKNFKFYKLDLLNNKKLTKIYKKEKPDHTYHFAAYAAEGLSPFIRNFNYNNNIISSINVINECIKYNSPICFTQSMAVYGEQTPPFTEDMTPKPIDPYGIAKYAVEMDLKNAKEQFGLDYTIVRPHNVIGIYQNIWDKYRNVAGIFIRKVLDKEDILVYGDGEQTRAFSDIKYYLEPMEKLMDKKFSGEVFNLGSDKYCSINQLAEIISEIGKKHGYDPSIKHVEPRNEAKHAYCDHEKAKKTLDLKDETNIEQMLEEMFIWAKSQPKRKVKKIPYEIEKNMYSFWKK
jgi:UDP-glucose 4-epimerase